MEVPVWIASEFEYFVFGSANTAWFWSRKDENVSGPDTWRHVRLSPYRLLIFLDLNCVWSAACFILFEYVGLCVFSLPIAIVMIEKIYMCCLIIIIKSEVWTITHCWGLGYETMVRAVCLSVFLWICDMAGLLRGTFVSWWYLPRIWPSVTDMQFYYHARYPTDDWHLAYMLSLVYFSVELCLVGVYPHSVSTRQIPASGSMHPSCWLPPSRENEIRTGGDPDLYLIQSRGHLNWRMGLPALWGGNLGCWIVWFPLILCSLMGCVISRIHYGLKVVVCFKHFTASHYHHHHTTLLMGIDHM